MLAQVDVEELESRHEREQEQLEQEIDLLRRQLNKVEQAQLEQRAADKEPPDWRAKLRAYDLKSAEKRPDGGK